MIIETVILSGAILLAANRIYNGLRGHAGVVYEGLIRNALVSNFSRFGNIDDYKIVVIDDSRGYFLRDNALWVCEVENDEIVNSSARPVDLMTIDSDKLKEAMAAVDTLNSEISDLTEEE